MAAARVDVRELALTDARIRDVRPWPVVIVGGVSAGLALGCFGRLFMRLLSDDPEFTWSGTLMIVGIFTVFGLMQGVAAAVRARLRNKWVTLPVRVVSGVSMALLAAGPGALMVPFTWCGALALWRVEWRRWARTGLASVAVVNFVAVSALSIRPIGWGPESAAGIVVFLAVYLGVISLAGATLRRRKA